MRRIAMTMGAVVSACGSGTSAVGAGPNDASVFMPPPANAVDGGGGGDSGALVSIYGQCSGKTAKPLIAGSYAEPRTGATLHWPEGWTLLDPKTTTGGVVTAPYTYVPTGATAPKDAQARLGISPSGVSGEAQAQEVLQVRAKHASDNGGRASQIQVGGHAAIVWWDEVPPLQPGCNSCPLDPGPDAVEIGLAIDFGETDVGFTVVELQGAARVNAQPVDVICDMEAMALGVTFGR
jgi:hypothetical protein